MLRLLRVSYESSKNMQRVIKALNNQDDLLNLLARINIRGLLKCRLNQALLSCVAIYLIIA